MKIALIGDVHANLPALEAVLAHAHEQGAQAIWHIGDFVGYGAHPDEVVQRLRQAGALSTIGNYDLKTLKFKEKQDKWRGSKRQEKWLAFKWAYENLSKKSRKYLRSLPQEIRMELGGRRLLLTHASPASNEEHLTPDTPEERLKELAKMAKADVIICGHSHQPFARQVDEVWFINTGSVGRPDDGDTRAAYAILDIEPERFEVLHYRLEYDVASAVAAIREHKLPEAFAQMMLQGRSLDEVRDVVEPHATPKASTETSKDYNLT
ncbi:MAG: metallophosphoesterase family protein [Anaerolineales bacterium]|nr:MAG: metallophosphoesterase family protein [Anaerolineales bacterium]